VRRRREADITDAAKFRRALWLAFRTFHLEQRQLRVQRVSGRLAQSGCAADFYRLSRSYFLHCRVAMLTRDETEQMKSGRSAGS
jgi:hypothetical protein